MTPEVYGLIQGCLADKLEDAGYTVDRGGKGRKGARLSNSRPSGLDWSKSLPTSLFYLPCQAQRPGTASFRIMRGRTPPFAALDLAPEHDVSFAAGDRSVQAPEVPRAGVDERLVQSAKDIWRASKGQPGRGDEMFFNLAMSLRRAGMDFYQIESTLRSEVAVWTDAQGTVVPNTEHHEQSSPVLRLGVIEDQARSRSSANLIRPSRHGRLVDILRAAACLGCQAQRKEPSEGHMT